MTSELLLTAEIQHFRSKSPDLSRIWGGWGAPDSCPSFFFWTQNSWKNQNFDFFQKLSQCILLCPNTSEMHQKRSEMIHIACGGLRSPSSAIGATVNPPRKSSKKSKNEITIALWLRRHYRASYLKDFFGGKLSVDRWHWRDFWDLRGRYEAFLDVSDVFLKCLDMVEPNSEVLGKSQNFDFFHEFWVQKRSWDSCLELPSRLRSGIFERKCCISGVRRSSEVILGMCPCISSPTSRLQKESYRSEKSRARYRPSFFFFL